METKRDDRRTQYSKRVIKESLLELLQEKPLNKITVKELCDRADVNRSTFYAYYTDIYELHRKMVKEFFAGRGFTLVEEDGDGNRLYELDISAGYENTNRYINVNP